ncbi:MAG: hypothetical protein ACTHOE_05080 [Conexibacter sp.]
MASAPEQLRDKASAAEDVLKTGAAAAGVAAATDLVNGGGPLAGPFALLGALLEALALVARAWANDPPRPDYRTRTRLAVRQLELSLFPDEPIASELRENAYWLTYSDAALGAALRAFERELGALAHDDAAAVEDRRRERIAYSGDAADGLRRAAVALERLASVLADDPRQARQTAPVPRPVAVEQLPDSLLSWLYRVEIPIANTKRLIAVTADRGARVERPEARVAAIRALPPRLAALAGAFEEWRSRGAAGAPPAPRPGQTRLFEE